MDGYRTAIAIWLLGAVIVFILDHITRSAYIMEERRSQRRILLGIVTVKKKGYFYLKIPCRVLRRAETTKYQILLRERIVRDNYMEDLILHVKDQKVLCKIDYRIAFEIKRGAVSYRIEDCNQA